MAEKGGVYVLDEPTSGLHLADVRQLLALLDRLVDAGKSVIVIEHHQAVMAHADWIIDLGPGAGRDGGLDRLRGHPGRSRRRSLHAHRRAPRGLRRQLTTPARSVGRRRSFHDERPYAVAGLPLTLTMSDAQTRAEAGTMDLPHVLAVWLHTLAFVIAWGYYGILGRMVLPAIERTLDAPTQGTMLADIERRALPLIVLSLVLFTITGDYLLVIDPQYEGLGQFFSSTWATLMLVKHGLVIGLVVAGVYVDRLIRRGAAATSDTERQSTLRRVGLGAEAATGLGALIALLTAAAQSAA